MRYLILGLLVLGATVHAAPSPRRCQRVCAWTAKHCAQFGAPASRPRRCARIANLVSRCRAVGRCSGSPTSTTLPATSTTTTSAATTTAIPTTTAMPTTTTTVTQTTTTTTPTTLPDISGWYGGKLYTGSICLDDVGHTGYTPPESVDVTLHVVGFAPDATAHYTIDSGYSCVGGWDTGAPADLTEPDDDPECLGCNRHFYGAWPPAECGGSWIVLGGSVDALSVKLYVGQPWECHNSASGTLFPIPPPS